MRRFLPFGIAAAALVLAACIMAPTDAADTPGQSRKPEILPKVIVGGMENIIPTPQWMKERPGQIVLVQNGEARAVLVISHNADPRERTTASHLQAWVEKICGVRIPVLTSLQALNGRTAIVIGSLEQGTIPDAFVLQLDEADLKFLTRRDRTDQDYVIDCLDRPGASAVILCGAGAQGAVNAAMSLVHALSLVHQEVTLKRVHIRDYPDVEFRWINALSPEGTPESMIDWAMEHKINVLRLRDKGPKEERLALSRYARERGIRLLQLFFGDFALKNRKTYPDGPVYSCIGEKEVNEGGYCMSNPALIAEKCRKLREFVEAEEPGCLYIHFLDIDYYRLTEEAWARRCPNCRLKWPNDQVEAADGKAGAQAALFGQLVDAVNGVKHPDSGYDASRDCLIIFVSAPYTRWSESDAAWEKELAYYKTVSHLIKPAPNVHFAIRENGPGENGTKRIADLAKALDQIGHGHKVMTYYHCADRRSTLGNFPVAHQLWRNFTCAAVMTKAFEGSGSILLAGSGHPLIDAEYAWNSKSLGFYLDPKTQSEFGKRFRSLLEDRFRAPEIQGPGGFVDRAMAHMYGPSNVGRMRPLYMPQEYAEGVPPILPPQGKTWFTYCQDKRSPYDSPQLNRKWAKLFAACETAGGKAMSDIQECLAADDFNIAYREYTERLLADVHLGLRIAKMAAAQADLMAAAGQSNPAEIDTAVSEWETALINLRGGNAAVLGASQKKEFEALAGEMDKGFREKVDILRRGAVR